MTVWQFKFKPRTVPARFVCHPLAFLARILHSHAICGLGVFAPSASFLGAFDHYANVSLLSQQRILGQIDLGREVIRAAAIGMQFLHQPSVRLDNFCLAGVGR